MVSFITLINSILRRLINNPSLNIKIQHILRPIENHKQIISDALKNIDYSKVIDYGCGEGIFSECFSKSKYCGYDPVVKKITYAHKRFIDYNFLSDIPDLSIFDLFFFNNLLHHMNPGHVEMLINKILGSDKENIHLLIIEVKPRNQQNNCIYKLLLRFEPGIHYSDPRPVNYYEQVMQNKGFSLIDKKDMDSFYLLIFKK